MRKIKFSDIKFREHRASGEGAQGLIFFPNGYGASIVRFKLSAPSGMPGNAIYGSNTSNDKEWEVAILRGNVLKWDLTYDTEITDDVMSHLYEADVLKVLEEIRRLPSAWPTMREFFEKKEKKDKERLADARQYVEENKNYLKEDDNAAT